MIKRTRHAVSWRRCSDSGRIKTLKNPRLCGDFFVSMGVACYIIRVQLSCHRCAGFPVDFPAQLFPGALLWFANSMLIVVLLTALLRAPLGRLWSNEFTHVYFAACVVLLLLWNTRVGVLPALNFHLLGVTAVTLMFGWAYAVFAVFVVTVGTIINQQGQWIGIGLNTLIAGCLPILVTTLLLRFAQRKLPHNFFVYVYINGFLAAGLSTVAVSSIGAALMLLVDSGNAQWLGYQLFPYLPLTFFSEAFINGTIMTAMVALRPGWVASFDDNLYIKNK